LARFDDTVASTGGGAEDLEHDDDAGDGLGSDVGLGAGDGGIH
jgi:hypothetical protein